MGAASFGAGSVAAEKHIARSGSISIGAGSYGAGSAAAASASATSLVRHASVPASPGASSGALPSGPSAASAVDNTDGPMVRTDRSGSIASAVSVDADLLPRTVEEAEPATSIAARQREIESESALPFGRQLRNQLACSISARFGAELGRNTSAERAVRGREGCARATPQEHATTSSSCRACASRRRASESRRSTSAERARGARRLLRRSRWRRQRPWSCRGRDP